MNMIITLSVMIVKDVAAFVILMSVMLLGFVKMYTVLHMGVGSEAEYSDISSTFVRLMIQTYKSSAGEVNVP